MDAIGEISAKLLQNSMVGRRQLATMRLLVDSGTPTGREQLIAAVQQEIGANCYGSKPEYTLAKDIRALKKAGLEIQYSRSVRQGGYYILSERQIAGPKAERMLRRIGWHESELAQLDIYAKMPPARKIAQMFALRGAAVHVLDERLRREHPDIGKYELALLRQAELAPLAEPPLRNLAAGGYDG